MSTNPKRKQTIIGAGIVGAMEAYYAWKDAEEKGEQIRISIYDGHQTLAETTVQNIMPSLTIDEMMAVIPPAPLLDAALEIPFNQPGGIRASESISAKIKESLSAQEFIRQVKAYSKDPEGHAARTKSLFELGRMSMDLWLEFYDKGDEELKKIMQESNFNPCREPDSSVPVLHDGFRIDLLYNITDASKTAESWRKNYLQQGYQSCRVLSPAEVKALDPQLTKFCEEHKEDANTWKNDAVALYRPGGCIDTQVFLPKFYDYLTRKMGTYINNSGDVKDCLRVKFNRRVIGVRYADERTMLLDGLQFKEGGLKQNTHQYQDSQYIFCTGEAVDAFSNLGFAAPAYAGFAGASLMLDITIPEDQKASFVDFNHCMEVHQVGVCLAWQGRFRDNKIFIGVAGTKAFYGNLNPNVNDEFTLNRNLLQLNMINHVLPQFTSLALGTSTKGVVLDATDLQTLEDAKIARRWAGVRAVAPDGYPTLGAVYTGNGQVANARVTTHLGSGGVSMAHAAVLVSRCGLFKNTPMAKLPLIQDVLEYSNSRRRF